MLVRCVGTASDIGAVFTRGSAGCFADLSIDHGKIVMQYDIPLHF